MEKKNAVESPTQQPFPTALIVAKSVEKSMMDVPAACPVDDIELRNAIWNITPDLNLGNPTVPSFDDFLMDHSADDNAGVLFDLS